MTNYYDILGLSETATTAEIKSAYRTLAKRYHPDLNPSDDATQRFIEIEEAYSCLINSDTRKAHDRLLYYKRSGKTQTTAEFKYRQDVNKRAQQAKRRAAMHARMNYKQYKKDDVLFSSAAAVFIQAGFFIVTSIIVGIVLYKIAVYAYGPDETTWGEHGIFKFVVLTFIGVLIGISYAYEPLVRYIIVGKPKRKKREYVGRK